MKQSLKSGIPEFDEAVEQFENGEINFVELTSCLWNKAYNIGQTEQCNIANVVGQSEQLLVFAKWIQENGNYMTPDKQVKYFLDDV